MRDDPKVASWHELLDKTVELGLGAALLTKDAIAKLVDDLVKRGAVSREDGRRLVADMLERGRKQKETMESFIVEVVERVLARADLARRSTVEQLEKQEAHRMQSVFLSNFLSSSRDMRASRSRVSGIRCLSSMRYKCSFESFSSAGSMSTTRSRMLGRPFRGEMVTELFQKATSVGNTWVLQARTGFSLMRTAQEPQMEERQAARKVSVLSCVSLMVCRTSRTVMPVSTSTLKTSK